MAHKKQKSEKLEYDSIEFIVPIMAACMSDLIWVIAVVIGIIPPFGIVAFPAAMLVHWVGGGIAAIFLFPKFESLTPPEVKELAGGAGGAAAGAKLVGKSTSGAMGISLLSNLINTLLNSRLILGIAIALPLPILSTGIWLACAMHNKVVKWITKQLILLAIPVGGEAAMAAEAAGAAAEGAEAAAAAARATQTAIQRAQKVGKEVGKEVVEKGAEHLVEKGVKSGIQNVGSYLGQKMGKKKGEGEEEEGEGGEGEGQVDLRTEGQKIKDELRDAEITGDFTKAMDLREQLKLFPEDLESYQKEKGRKRSNSRKGGRRRGRAVDGMGASGDRTGTYG